MYAVAIAHQSDHLSDNIGFPDRRISVGQRVSPCRQVIAVNAGNPMGHQISISSQ
jgi:hypothetical protein